MNLLAHIRGMLTKSNASVRVHINIFSYMADYDTDAHNQSHKSSKRRQRYNERIPYTEVGSINTHEFKFVSLKI